MQRARGKVKSQETLTVPSKHRVVGSDVSRATEGVFDTEAVQSDVPFIRMTTAHHKLPEDVELVTDEADLMEFRTGTHSKQFELKPQQLSDPEQAYDDQIVSRAASKTGSQLVAIEEEKEGINIPDIK